MDKEQSGHRGVGEMVRVLCKGVKCTHFFGGGSFPFGTQMYNKLRVNKRELKLKNFILQGL